jgi:5-methylcytosine-specific restriction endonuclease McrA
VKPQGRQSFKPWRDRLYRRAVSGDLEFGHICPTCAGPKSDQALLCRRCFADKTATHGLTRKGVMRYDRRRSEARIVNYHGPGT